MDEICPTCGLEIYFSVGRALVRCKMGHYWEPGKT